MCIRDERWHHSTAADTDRQDLAAKLAIGEFKLCNVSHLRAQVFCLERKLEYRPHMEDYRAPSKLDQHFILCKFRDLESLEKYNKACS